MLGTGVPGVVVVALLALVTAVVATVLAIAKVAGEPSVVAVVNAGKAGPREAEQADAEEPEGLRDTYRLRRIHLRGLKKPAKWLLRVALAQIVLVAVLMALQRVRQPLVNSAVLGAAGSTLAVPLVVFIVMVISLAAGYWFGLAGALRVRASAGIPIAALATWTLADEPVALLRLGGTSITPDDSYAGLRWAQLGVLAVFWVWLGAAAIARWRGRRERPAGHREPDNGQPWNPGIFWTALACVLSYYALELVIWIRYARAGQTATGTGSLLQDLGVQAILLPTFLILVVLLGSTDLLEWGEIAVASLVSGPLVSGPLVSRARRERPLWLLAVLTPLAAVAMLANVIRLDGASVLAELAVVGGPAVLLAALARLAPGYGTWSADIRGQAVFTGAVVVFVFIDILRSATSALRGALGWSEQLDPRFYWLVSTPLALAALTVGLFFLTDARIGKGEQRGRGLLLVVVGGLLIISALPNFLSSAHLPAVLPRHFSLPGGLQAVASVGTLGWLAGLTVRGRLKAAAPRLAIVLGLLAGLALVGWIYDLLQEITKLSAYSDYLLGALFFLTVCWAFATSGENLTGRKANTVAYPRDGRILLFVSYSLIANALLLYLGAVRGTVNGPSPPDYLSADPVTPLGLVVLGSALVIVAFVTRMAGVGAKDSGRVRGEPARAGAPRIRRRRAAQAIIAGVGTVATGAALVALGTALPGLTQANAALLSATYGPVVPGPGCDTAGALWTVTPDEPITTTCAAGGLRVQIGAGPKSEGDVKFLPPNGFTTQNYRISVTIAFSRGFDGCAGIFTRASAAGRYLTDVCPDGSAGIEKTAPHASCFLGPLRSCFYLNFVDPASVYTVTAVSAGPGQSVYVDGAKVATVTDAALPETEYVGLGVINNGAMAGSAVFSKFAFTPLP